jgi:hypothetical protein
MSQISFMLDRWIHLSHLPASALGKQRVFLDRQFSHAQVIRGAGTMGRIEELMIPKGRWNPVAGFVGGELEILMDSAGA